MQSVKEMTKDFESVEPLSIVQTVAEDFFQITEIDESTVAKTITKLSNSKSNDIYNMNSCFVKRYQSALVKPLTHLINLSIRTCTFPSTWKKAVIVLILKS